MFFKRVITSVISSSHFYVNEVGDMSASNAWFTGTVTASVNGASPFPVSASGSGAYTENDLGPQFPGGVAIDTLSISLAGGSNNSNYTIGRLEINGVVVTFGQNWI